MQLKGLYVIKGTVQAIKGTVYVIKGTVNGILSKHFSDRGWMRYFCFPNWKLIVINNKL